MFAWSRVISLCTKQELMVVVYNKKKRRFMAYTDMSSCVQVTGLTIGILKGCLTSTLENDDYVVGHCELVRSIRGGMRKGGFGRKKD